MSSSKKVLLLVLSLILLIIYTLASFDYDTLKHKTSYYSNSNKQTILEPKDINFEIVKNQNIVILSGTFKDDSQAEMLSNHLNVNKIDKKSFDEAIIYSQDRIDEIKKLISPLKDYFEDGSKIVLKNKQISLEGTLKETKFQALIEAIVNRSNSEIKTYFNQIEEPKQEEKAVVIEEEYDSLQDEINSILEDKKIAFKTNSTEVVPESIATIEEIVALIKKSSKDIFIEVAGHTDAKGEKSTNKWISNHRAKSVMKKFIEFGISSDIIQAKGYGESKPLVANDENGYSRINRRVEIIIYDLDKIEEKKIALQDEIDSLVKQQKINFERRSVKVTAESLEVIKKIAELIKNSENLSIEVGGHTDAKGSEALNKRISLNRAKSVVNELLNVGVEKSKLIAVGYGESQPIAQNDENGLSEINRRVEFIVKGVK